MIQDVRIVINWPFRLLRLSTADRASRRGWRWIEFQLVTPVASFAFGWRGLVEKDGLAVQCACEFVTAFTRYILVRTLEREFCARFVVEIRRFPPPRIVATGTIVNFLARSELAAMRILMASGALFRCGLEIYIFQRRLQVGRAMAVRARHAAVCAEQGKLGLRVIELA
jgi:hypothetical protein